MLLRACGVVVGKLGQAVRPRIETRTSDGSSNASDPKEMVELDALPEECIAQILSLPTPSDAARSSAVSRTFRSASDSDAAWNKFLPPDLDLIVSTSLRQPLGPSLTRKKDVFLRLCSAPLLINDGHKGKLSPCLLKRDVLVESRERLSKV